MKWLRVAGLAGAAAALVAAVTTAFTSCSQTPTNVPVRTFQQARKVDVVCMQVNDANGNPLSGTALKPLPADQCPPLPLNGNGATAVNHLYAVVTQTTPGTLAVVDLTNGAIVDEDHATPGINFIPVGAQPTDVAVSPDGAMTFVTSADVNKPALYAIDNRRLLGDSTGNPPRTPLQLTDLPACALPQPPDAMTIAPLADGKYVVLAMLRQWGTCGGDAGAAGCAKIVAIDPTSLLHGAGLTDAGSTSAPGTLGECPTLSATGLSSGLPSSWTLAPSWPNGIPYTDAGANLADAEPPLAVCPAGPVPGPGDSGIPLGLGPLPPAYPTYMALRSDLPLLYVADGAVPVIHVIDVSDPTNIREQAPLLATTIRNPNKRIPVGPIAISPPTRDYKRYLYAVDLSEGDVMVYDITDPTTSPTTPLQRPNPELNPFIPLDRLAFDAPVAAVTFIEHDWLLPSQADTYHYYSGILCNPNPNAHPGQSNTSAPFLAKGAYYRADQASLIQNTGTVEGFPQRLRGVFGVVTLTDGSIVPIDVDDWDAPCRRPDPMLVGGDGLFAGQTGSLDFPEPPPTSSSDLDEYHVPVAYQSFIPESAAVTLEAFFPVSAPHRVRSNYLLLNDPTAGNHQPNLLNIPRLFDLNGTPIQTGMGSPGAPLLLPTQLPSNFVDPGQASNPTEPNPALRLATNNSLASPTFQPQTSTDVMNAALAATTPGVRISYDDPTVHIDQNWQVTYEGVLPGTPGIAADINADSSYHTLVLTTGVTRDAGGPANGLSIPGFCGLGVEDWTIGQARRAAIGDAKSGAWTADYVEFADDLLPSTDPYWAASGNACWQNTGLDDTVSDVASKRYNACADRFGANATDAGTSGSGTLADSFLTRDFPILQAFNDHLVLGRFGWNPNLNEQTSNRVVVGADPTNEQFLRYAQCCFHRQTTFKVRTGGEWNVVGGSIGFLHHVFGTGPGGACQLSCFQVDALKNGRALDLTAQLSQLVGPGALDGGVVSDAGSPGGGFLDGGVGEGGVACTSPTSLPNIGRNDPRAMRNPMFSFFMLPPCGPGLSSDVHTLVARDTQWHFQLRGGFSPLTVSLSQGTGVGVSPQSMRFIEPFGQLAVVDGAQQGLVLIDLNTLGFAHTPYF